MSVKQINIWECELCDKMETTITNTSPYSDPVVVPLNQEEWGYIDKDGKEIHVCPKCLREDKK